MLGRTAATGSVHQRRCTWPWSWRLSSAGFRPSTSAVYVVSPSSTAWRLPRHPDAPLGTVSRNTDTHLTVRWRTPPDHARQSQRPCYRFVLHSYYSRNLYRNSDHQVTRDTAMCRYSRNQLWNFTINIRVTLNGDRRRNNLKTERLAVYLETYNISSKRAFPTSVLDRWHNCLLIYWRNVAQLPHPHRFVYFCIMTQQDVHGDRQRLPTIWVGTFLVRSIQTRGKTLNLF